MLHVSSIRRFWCPKWICIDWGQVWNYRTSKYSRDNCSISDTYIVLQPKGVITTLRGKLCGILIHKGAKYSMATCRFIPGCCCKCLRNKVSKTFRSFMFPVLILNCQDVYGVCIFMDSANVPCLRMDIPVGYHSRFSMPGKSIPWSSVTTELDTNYCSDHSTNSVLPSHMESSHKFWSLALLQRSNCAGILFHHM